MSYLPERGRLERRIDELARGLAKRGAEVEILTQGPAQLVPEHREGVIIRRFPTVAGPLRFPSAPRLRERLRAASPPFDVVDVHTRQLSLAMAVASTRVHPLVLTPSAPLDAFTNWRHAGTMRAVVGAAAQIVCPSEFERDVVCIIVPDARHRTQVLPDGVDAAALRAAEPFDSDDVVVLAVDRLEQHGVGRAIAAMPVSIPSSGWSWSAMDRRELASPRSRLTYASLHACDSWALFLTKSLSCSAGCAPRVL